MKESIKVLKQKLDGYYGCKSNAEEDFIEVIPNKENGFSVSFYDCGEEIIVSYGGWHEHFTDQESAMKCFQFGLSEKCRLKVYSRGNYEYKWTVQYLEGKEWLDYDTTGLIFFPFWKSRSIKYLQNQLEDGI